VTTRKHPIREQHSERQLPLPNVLPDELTEEQVKFQIGRLLTLSESFVSSHRQVLEGRSSLLATPEIREPIWLDFTQTVTDILSIAARLKTSMPSSIYSFLISTPDGDLLEGVEDMITWAVAQMFAEIVVGE